MPGDAYAVLACFTLLPCRSWDPSEFFRFPSSPREGAANRLLSTSRQIPGSRPVGADLPTQSLALFGIRISLLNYGHARILEFSEQFPPFIGLLLQASIDAPQFFELASEIATMDNEREFPLPRRNYSEIKIQAFRSAYRKRISMQNNLNLPTSSFSFCISAIRC